MSRHNSLKTLTFLDTKDLNGYYFLDMAANSHSCDELTQPPSNILH